jgi:transcriptional regulator with XRE-family HTH domain
LADLAGISRVTYGRLERGEIATVSIKTIDIVLSALDYEIDIKAKEAYGIPVLE